MSAASPYLVTFYSVFHALVGMSATIGLYLTTDLFSLGVDQTLTHPFGRSCIRRTDWMLIGLAALSYFPVSAFMWSKDKRFQSTADMFVSAALAATFVHFASAVFWPTLLTPHPQPLSITTATGALWWYSGVALTAPLVGLAGLAAGSIWRSIRRG